MANLTVILGLIENKVELLPGSPVQYAGSDWLDVLASVASLATVYQLRAQHQLETIGSNEPYQTAAVEVVMIHHMNNSEHLSERLYTHGEMLLDQAELLDRNWWDTIAGIRQLQPDIGRPELEQNVERIGNVIHYSVLVQFEIVPD
jgi:hypothetical protein